MSLEYVVFAGTPAKFPLPRPDRVNDILSSYFSFGHDISSRHLKNVYLHQTLGQGGGLRVKDPSL